MEIVKLEISIPFLRMPCGFGASTWGTAATDATSADIVKGYEN